MNYVRPVPWMAGLALALCLSCRQEVQIPQPGRNADDRKVFQVSGVVEEVMPERQKLKIQHEQIPGYMEAMTMTFDVRGVEGLDQFAPGDTVSFQMVVTSDDGWIENVTKTGQTNPPVRTPFRVVREVEPLQEGDYMPHYSFTNQLGKLVSFSDFKGQAVAFTFIYTRCPFPTFCPRMASNFAAVQEQLKSQPDAPTNWHLLCITLDPEFDTPALLQAYAKQFNYDPNRWSFLTGELIDITAAAEQFGLMFWRSDPTKPASIDHNLRTIVLDQHGRISRIIPENEWKPDDLAKAIEEAAGAEAPGADAAQE